MPHRVLLAALAAGSLAGLALPGGALAATGARPLVCTGDQTGGTYSAVIVPANDSCTLTDVTVLGSITVANSASLDLAPSTSPSATVGGGILGATNSDIEQDSGWTTDGTITATGASFVIVDGGITHNVVSASSDNVYVFDATVDGSITATATQSFGEIASNLNVTGDVSTYGEPSSSGGFVIEDQTIGGSVNIVGNQAPTTVELNEIGHNLVCVANNPPPTDNGFGNYVHGREVGQCAGLPSAPGDGPGD